METIAAPALPALLCAIFCGACRAAVSEPSPPPGRAMGSLTVTSTSFLSNGAIPVDYTCDGASRSPQLTWSAPPDGTRGFALVADDPDAPGGTFTHWIGYALPADLRAIPENVDLASLGASTGTNDFKRPGYGGPCPPRYEDHHYFFRVFALDAALHVSLEPDREAIDAAMRGHVLAAGSLVGEFSH